MSTMDASLTILSRTLTHCIALLPSGVAGLVSLADLRTIQTKAALTGKASILDVFVLCPGLQRQQDSPDLSRGEYPACAAMTTGYAFRVENEATVFQLQRLGRPGHLTTLTVTSDKHGYPIDGGAERIAVTMTLTSAVLLASLEDYSALTALIILLFIRAVNVAIFRSRSKMGWKGALEPGVKADLIVLLSQDKWIRIRGLVDDVKAITSGQWLRDMSFAESSLVSLCKLILYFDAALMWEASKPGQFILLTLMLATTALMGLSNEYTTLFKMYGRSIRSDDPPKAYNRRLDLAKVLIDEIGRDDWAIRLGMIQPKSSDQQRESELGPKIM